ncbi:hypothetical protein FBUS_00321 [Fasciolopsis buskii]|uniref:BZIP domain-containing protein n=1 Tax=Fasciolopsis buskii TaxID=27845 RepID=A0A8E0VI20_9TREM|nr:hypothetical protein FBUS_00321 [Fasciolopsis buski]
MSSQVMSSGPHSSTCRTYNHPASHLAQIPSATSHVSGSTLPQVEPIAGPSTSRQPERAPIELASSITSALFACDQASSFDLPELQGAFVRFFEEGEVSDELDNYFTKLLESVSTGAKSTQSTQSVRSTSSSETSRIRSPQPRPSGSSNVGTSTSDVDQRKLRERRERNNEASRRSRAANKARFQSLIRSIQRLETENQQLTIWLREVHHAIQEAKDILLGAQNEQSPTQSDSP